MFQFLTNLSAYSALSIAILCEVVATSTLPKTEGLTQPLPTLIVLLGYGLAFFLLSVTIRTIPVGIAYAIWCGAGIILISLISWLWYGQKLDGFAILGMAMILIGVLIINLLSKSAGH